jgi:hypothetical protein
MKQLILLTVTLAIALGLAACEEGNKTAPDKAPAAATAPLTAEGTTYEPPIAIDDVPAGAWYCDMGTSHYARSEKGDGKCGVCKMDLKEKAK